MEVSARAAQVIARLFEHATGQLLSQERAWRIWTTLTPFCRARGIQSFDHLADLLERSADRELSLDMIDALLNNETSFFRDATVFEQISEKLLPRIAEARQEQKRIRIWSAACSTGQEAYSLAMLFAEQRERWEGWKIEILGSDISRTAIQQARHGLYSQLEVQRGLAARRLIDWFDPVLDQGWRSKAEITAMVSFARHNLLGPPPAGGRFDLILCRNVLLYFPKERRHQLLEGLALGVAADGALILGAGETVSGFSTRFESDPGFQTVYRPVLQRPVHRAA